MLGIDYALLLTIISAVVGFLAWYRTYARAVYSREREIIHIKKGIEQLSTAIAASLKDVDNQVARNTDTLERLSAHIDRLEMQCSFSQRGDRHGES